MQDISHHITSSVLSFLYKAMSLLVFSKVICNYNNNVRNQLKDEYILYCQTYSTYKKFHKLKLLSIQSVHNSSDFLKFGYKRKLSQFHKLNLGAKLRILCLSFCSIDSSFLFFLFINKIPAKLPRYLINKKGQNTLTENSTTLKSFRKIE